MRVPVYERRQEIAPLTAPQTSPLMPAGDYGANAANVVKTIADRVSQIQNDHEDARTLELFNKYKAESINFHEDPEKGIYNTRTGYLSQGVYSDADKWLKEKGEEYARLLKSERAKKNFRDMARGYITQQGNQNSRFEASQMKKYRDDQADAAIENALNDIALNPYDEDAWNQNRQQIENAYELKLRGASDEVKDLAWANFKNDTAVARFNAMLQDDPGKADEWYQANKDSFSAESRLKAENALETYRVQNIVDELTAKFPEDREQDALKFVRENYSGQREERIAAALKTRNNERAIKANAEARLNKLHQDELEERLTKQFITGTPPSEAVLRQLLTTGQLRSEQYDRLIRRTEDLADRAKFTQRLLRQNPNATQQEIDVAFMRSRGTTNEAHNRAFAYAVNAILTGQANESILDDYHRRGLLTAAEVERIKRNVKKLDDAQSNFYNQQLSIVKTNLTEFAKDCDMTDTEKGEIETMFVDRAGMLDKHDKDYRQKLQEVRTAVLTEAVDILVNRHGKSKEGWIWGKTKLGEKEEAIQSSIYIPELDAAEWVPDVLDLTPVITEPPAMGMVQGTITGRFADWRAYRNGQHNGIDVAAPAGSDIVMQDYGTPLTVSKVNTSTPSKGGGNSVTLSGTYGTGDTIDVIISHMQNDSIAVNVGDVVDVGTIIGKVGNTGMTSENGKITPWREDKKTGFHMDLKIKINGKYVDPETFVPPRPQADRQGQSQNAGLEAVRALGSLWDKPVP